MPRWMLLVIGVLVILALLIFVLPHVHFSP
jgi:hypothetical protein